MKFQLRPILQEMKELYAQPISPERFQAYLSKLQGGKKGDLQLPISGFNPMAKGHVLEKIEALEKVGAEELMREVISKFNHKINSSDERTVEVVLNLADDLKGAWTNFYTTDFDSKFKINAFVHRNFCLPFFWTSENYSEELVKQRTEEYLNRTLYWMEKKRPKSLREHLEQEVFVAQNMEGKEQLAHLNFDKIAAHFLTHQDSEEYNLIFNFFYGDVGSENLGYKKFGVKEISGFEYARFVASGND